MVFWFFNKFLLLFLFSLPVFLTASPLYGKHQTGTRKIVYQPPEPTVSTVIQAGHIFNVNCICISQDDKLIATLDEEDFVKIWDVETGRLIKNWKFKASGSNYERLILFDKKNNLIVFDDAGPSVWNPYAGEKNGNLNMSYASMNDVAVSIDGSTAAFFPGSKSPQLSKRHGTAAAAKAMFGKCTREAPCKAPDRLSSKQKRNKNYSVDIWSLDSKQFVRRINLKHYAVSIKISPNGKFIIAKSISGKVARFDTWNATQGNLVASFTMKDIELNQRAISPDGTVAVLDAPQGYKHKNGSGKSIRSHRIVLRTRNGSLIKSFPYPDIPVPHLLRNGPLVGSFSYYELRNGEFSIDGTKFAGDDNTVWNTKDWEPVYEGKDGGWIVALSRNSQFLVSSEEGQRSGKNWHYSDYKIWLHDIVNKAARPFCEKTNWLKNVAISPNGLQIVVAADLGYDGQTINELRLFNLSTGQLLWSRPSHVGQNKIKFSDDGRYLLAGIGNPDIDILDTQTGNVISSIPLISHENAKKRRYLYHEGTVNADATILQDGKYLAVYWTMPFVESKSRIDIFDIMNPNKVFRLDEERTDESPFGLSHSHDGKLLAQVFIKNDGKDADKFPSQIINSKLKVRIWNLDKRKIIREFPVMFESNAPVQVAFSMNDKHLLVGNRIYEVSGFPIGDIWNWRLTNSDFQLDMINTKAKIYVELNKDYNLLINDNITIYDFPRGKIRSTLYSFPQLTVWMTPEGYFAAFGDFSKYIHFVKTDKIYELNQFYDVFYRPDIVMTRLRGEDIHDLVTLTIDDAIKNPPPVVEFTSKLTDTEQSIVKVCYQVRSIGGGIGEVRLFHNGKLIQSDGYYRDTAMSSLEKKQLLAMNGKTIYENMRSVNVVRRKSEITHNIIRTKGDVFEDCKEVEVVSGENEVGIAAFNSGNTVQSYLKTIKFNSAIKSEDPHLYVLSIGIDKYKDNMVNLKYATKDTIDIEAKLIKQSATIYKTQNIHHEILIDDKANKENIISKTNKLSSIIKPNDGFILYFAGHGVLFQNQYYMLTYDYDGNLTDSSMISSNEIVEMSKKIRSLSQLFIFDTCHAGGVDYIVSGLYDARMSVLAKKMGLHIYASASDKQSAMDGYKGNGLFSYTLLDGLNNNKAVDKNNDGKVSVVGLGNYSKRMTTDISKNIGHNQTPLIINFGKDYPLYKLR